MTPRTYHSEVRAARAAETRRRILTAAGELFATRGYTGATFGAIAEAAGCSVETVKLQGAKHELLLGAYELLFAGREGTGQISEDPEGRRAIAETPPEHLPDLVAATLTGMNARARGLWRAFTGAAQSDPEVAVALADLLIRRRRDYDNVVAALEDAGLVTARTAAAELAAELSFLGSPEGYQQLVLESGWSVDRYRDWLAGAIRRAIRGD